MMEFRTVAHDSADYWKKVDLRRRVLRAPLGRDYVHDELMAEGDDIHLAVFENEVVLGTVILSPPSEDGAPHLRQMAVAPEVQGRGLGAKLVRELENVALARGWNRIVLAARETAVPFYQKQGYAGEGDIYMRVGVPHRQMTKDL